MKRSYVFFHWLLTLLVAPLVSQGILYMFGENPHQVAGLLEFYPTVFIISIIFSLPTFIVYATCFYFLKKHNASEIFSRLNLVGISVLGVFITIVIYGNASDQIAMAYGVTALVFGLILKLKSTPDKPNDSINTT